MQDHDTSPSTPVQSSRLREAFEILLGNGGDMPNNPTPPPPPSKRGRLAPRKTTSEKYIVSLYNYAEDTLQMVEVPWKEEFRTYTQIACDAFPEEFKAYYNGSKYSSFQRGIGLSGLKVEILELK